MPYRSRIIILLLCGISMIVSLEAATAEVQASEPGQVTLDDPIFGITYSTSSVNYDQIPPEVKQLCPHFNDGHFWVYAHFRAENGDYYIVMGIRPDQDSDSLGVALWIEGSKCRGIDSNWMLSGRPKKEYGKAGSLGGLPGLDAPRICPHGPAGDCYYDLQSADNERILRGLTGDAIQRAIKAYGGEAQFKKYACSPSELSESDAPIVQQELQKFCSSSP